MNKSLKLTLEDKDIIKEFILKNKESSDVFYSFFDSSLDEEIKDLAEEEFENVSDRFDSDIARKHISGFIFSYSFYVIILGKRVFCGTSDLISYDEFLTIIDQLKNN